MSRSLIVILTPEEHADLHLERAPNWTEDDPVYL
jgi:hypothetical protein